MRSEVDEGWDEKIEEDVIDYVDQGAGHGTALLYRERALAHLRRVLASLTPQREPVSHVLWVPIEQVEANDYNPNAVARIEMGLLLKSIQKDGFTQPIVTIYDPDRDVYVIVDGFHRYYLVCENAELRARLDGMVPVVVIDKTVNERMAATVRHNRARGKHSITGMASMVFSMLENGMSDADVCNELGLEPEELLKLKHVTGFSYLYADHTYNRAWITKSQIKVATEHGVSLLDS